MRWEGWLPIRLLAIGGLDGTDFHLVEASELPLGTNDATMSQCWGFSRIITLRQSTINKWEKECFYRVCQRHSAKLSSRPSGFGLFIFGSTLSVAFKTPSETGRERQWTWRVFTRTLFCIIAAAAASESSQGYFFERDPESIKGCVVSATWMGGHNMNLPKGNLYCVNSKLWSAGVTEASLNQRAWVVQERLLSVRVLFFGEKQIFWECYESIACETFPSQTPSALRFIYHKNHVKRLLILRSNLDEF